jgi:RND superfamily putative drug exporter
LRRTGTNTTAGGGVFAQIADLVVRWPRLVVGCWVLLAAALPTMFPSLTQLAQKSPTAMLPPDAPGSVSAKQMTEAFRESGSQKMLLIVLTNEKGRGPADENVYRKLVDSLRTDPKDVVMVR